MPIKVNFHVTAVVDPDDGLQPSDLTPETANVRVMILKVNKVRFTTCSCSEVHDDFSSLTRNQGKNHHFYLSLIDPQSKPILVATIAMPAPEIFQQDVY